MVAPPELVRRSWLERMLDVVRELSTTRELSLLLNRIAYAAVDFLEFGAAAINVVSPDGVVEVAAVAGPLEMRGLLGTRSALPRWLEMFEAAEAWGSLRFYSHEQDQSLFDEITSWVPDQAGDGDPDAWHAEDALFAPLTAPDGSLLGVLSVDQPASGRMPSVEQRTILEMFASQAAVAIHDFQVRERSEAALRDAEHRWQVTFERSPIGAAIVDRDAAMLQVNDSLAGMLGYPRGALVGVRLCDVTHPDDVYLDQELFDELTSGIRDSYEMSKRYLRPDGAVVYGLLHMGAIRDGGGQLRSIVAQVNDVTQARQAEDRLAHHALHDALTDLPNRALLEQLLSAYLATGQPTGILYCDLDRFKTVNDSLGHEAGDQLLIELTRAFARRLPATCTLGRVGGDEFVVLVPGEDDTEELRALAEELMATLDAPLTIGDHLHVSTVSIGITVGKPSHGHPDAVLREADLALLRAKRSGRTRIEVYDPTQDKPATVHDLELEQALRAALAGNHGLIPYFQPIVSLADGIPVGYEALIRWRHERDGMLDPQDFLPMAEQAGLIVPLGWWMLAVSCLAAKDVRLTGGWSRWVAVNASASQLGRGALLAEIRRGLDSSGLPADRLHLEITESALLDASPAVVKEIREVADLGVRIALDDFGTGYSSLSLLRDLPVSTVKIDKTFVTPIASDRAARAIVRSVITLCHELGITTVAEGIETQEQLTSLRALGCNLGQGYLLGRPRPLQD
jgi:diguanylate cyclase (GGDEF)-like protein/PAS domain S-box-containing protein